MLNPVFQRSITLDYIEYSFKHNTYYHFSCGIQFHGARTLKTKQQNLSNKILCRSQGEVYPKTKKLKANPYELILEKNKTNKSIN